MRQRSSKAACLLRREDGGVLVLFAICLVAMLGVLGLAIDTGISYFAKARLSLAADSAVLAAAEVYQHDPDKTAAADHARQAADSYFHTNYPRGFLGTTNTQGRLDISVTTGETRLKYIASTKGLLTFAKVMTDKQLAVNTAPEVLIRKPPTNVWTNIALVVDESGSIGEDDFRKIVGILGDYIDKLDNQRSRVALIPFSSRAEVAVRFKRNGWGFDPKEVKQAMIPYENQGTSTYKALGRAGEEMSQVSGRKVILLVTDGLPTDANEWQMYTRAKELYDQGSMIFVIGWGPSLQSDLIMGRTGEHMLQCMIGHPGKDDQVCFQRPMPGSQYCPGYDAPALRKCLEIQSGRAGEVSALVY